MSKGGREGQPPSIANNILIQKTVKFLLYRGFEKAELKEKKMN